MGFGKLIKSLFSGSSGAAGAAIKPSEPIEYKGLMIEAAPIDEDGKFRTAGYISGELDGAFYDDVDGLTNAMRNHRKLPYCLVNRLYAYGTGGPVSLRHDRDILAHFVERFAGHGYKVPDLLREIATSQAFLKVRPELKPADSVVAATGALQSQNAANQR